MTEIEGILDQAIGDILHSTFGVERGPAIQFQQTRKEFEGEVTVVTFPYVKMLKKSPEEIGKTIGEALVAGCQEVVGYNVVKGFLNLEIAPAYWLGFLNTALKTEHFGRADADSRPLAMIEYASPNTNKPLHLGHLRNIFLGWSVSNILREAGHAIKRVQIVNDRGIHICKSMYAWQKLGNGETPESSGTKGDKLVGKYYVAFEQLFQKEYASWLESAEGQQAKTDFLATPKGQGLEKKYAQYLAAEEKKGKTAEDRESWMAAAFKSDYKNTYFNTYSTVGEGAREMLQKWEQKEPEVYALWQKMNGWVYAGFDETFATMGVSIDKSYYESDTYLIGKEKVLEGLKKGVFEQEEDGSIWVDLTAEGMDRKILLRSDGTAVYMTQDIGTAILRFEDNPDLASQIYTVGNEQDYHFKVLFKILAKLGYTWADDCYHLSYGMVELPEGKMKSREGTVVDADDLMAEMVTTAKETTEELGKLDGVSHEEREALYSTIGIGALKYFLLKVDPKKGMLFDPKGSIDFAGNTAPFIQYTHARIKSILRRYDGAVPEEVSTEVTLDPMEKDLLTAIYQYPTVIREAAENYSPALVANYVYDLVKTFNTYYQAVPILKESDAAILEMRIALISAVADVVKSAMGLLGIDVPEQM